MYLVVICNEYGIHIVKLIDELHASVKAEQEACGAQGIGGEGRICYDRDTVQIIVARVTGPGIQYVMVYRAVLLKIPLVDA